MAATIDNGNGTYDDVRCESVQSQRDDIDSYALLGGIVYSLQSTVYSLQGGRRRRRGGRAKS